MRKCSNCRHGAKKIGKKCKKCLLLGSFALWKAIKKRLLIALIAVLITTNSAHAGMVVTNPVSDTLRGIVSQIEQAQAWTRTMWEEIKEEYKWLIDLGNDVSALSNQIMQIQNQYEQLAYMYEKTTDLDPSNFLAFTASLGQLTNNIDDMFDQAEGLTATAGDMQDKFDAVMPRVYGMATGDEDHWKDFFAASEEAKHYSVKNNLRGLQDVRNSWREVKKQLRDIQIKNKNAANEKQIMKVTNEILLREQAQLAELKKLLASQTDLLATTAIALENEKKKIGVDTKNVMELSKPAPTIDGPGLFRFR